MWNWTFIFMQHLSIEIFKSIHTEDSHSNSCWREKTFVRLLYRYIFLISVSIIILMFWLFMRFVFCTRWNSEFFITWSAAYTWTKSHRREALFLHIVWCIIRSSRKFGYTFIHSHRDKTVHMWVYNALMKIVRIIIQKMNSNLRSICRWMLFESVFMRR